MEVKFEGKIFKLFMEPHYDHETRKFSTLAIFNEEKYSIEWDSFPNEDYVDYDYKNPVKAIKIN